MTACWIPGVRLEVCPDARCQVCQDSPTSTFEAFHTSFIDMYWLVEIFRELWNGTAVHFTSSRPYCLMLRVASAVGLVHFLYLRTASRYQAWRAAICNRITRSMWAGPSQFIPKLVTFPTPNGTQASIHVFPTCSNAVAPLNIAALASGYWASWHIS